MKLQSNNKNENNKPIIQELRKKLKVGVSKILKLLFVVVVVVSVIVRAADCGRVSAIGVCENMLCRCHPAPCYLNRGEKSEIISRAINMVIPSRDLNLGPKAYHTAVESCYVVC